jgi:hypothetical protein
MASLQTDSSSPLTYGEQIFTISDRSDTTISLLGAKNQQGQYLLTKFEVEEETLTSFSNYFEASIRFNTSYGHDVELKDDDAGAIRVWLLYMQAAKETAAKRLTPKGPRADGYIAKERKIDEATEDILFEREGVATTDITRIWHIIDTGDKYLFDGALLIGFFERWYNRNVDLETMQPDFARQLALPCYMFDYAHGFAQVTKWMAYNIAGHITEKRPPGFKWKHMHLCPPNFVGMSLAHSTPL